MKKKNIWIIAGIAALILAAIIIFNMPVKSDGCLPDGSCCANACAC